MGGIFNRGQNPTQRNLTLVTAGVEYTATLPAGTKKFQVTVRGESGQDTTDDIRYSWTTGHVAGRTSTFGVLIDGSCWWEDHVEIATNKYLYFACSTAGVVVQIEYWR